MAVEERRRIALHRAAAESWGEEVADTLVELVAPSGHELATRADIQGVLEVMAAMDERWDERIAALEARWDERIAALEARWDERFAVSEARWDERFAVSEARWDERFAALEARWDERFVALEARWDERFVASEARTDERQGEFERRLDIMDGAWQDRLAASDARTEAGLHSLRADFERSLREALTRQTRVVVVSLVATVVSMSGVTITVAAMLAG
jgi:hypothetical protein